MSSSKDGNIKSLKCEFCPIVFSKIDNLANHLVNGHANNFKIEPEDYLEIEENAENQVQRIQDDRNCHFWGYTQTMWTIFWPFLTPPPPMWT